VTQHYIRRLAGYGPIRRAIMKLHEPRWVSAIYGGLYLSYLVFGALSIINPSLTISDAAGVPLTTTMSLAMVAAGAIGVVSVGRGAYWAERFAVISAALGITGYGATTIWLALTQTGYRWWPLMLILGSAVALAVRPAWIWSREYSPNKVHKHR